MFIHIWLFKFAHYGNILPTVLAPKTTSMYVSISPLPFYSGLAKTTKPWCSIWRMRS